MQAIRITAWEQPAELVNVPVPEPGPGEVLVRVTGAGLCHSDLHLMHWPAGALPYELPFTLGHEIAGVGAGRGPRGDPPRDGGAGPDLRAVGMRPVPPVQRRGRAPLRDRARRSRRRPRSRRR